MPVGYVPDLLQPLLDPAGRVFPKLVDEAGLRIGPIPAGTPVNLLANVNLLPHARALDGGTAAARQGRARARAQGQEAT